MNIEFERETDFDHTLYVVTVGPSTPNMETLLPQIMDMLNISNLLSELADMPKIVEDALVNLQNQVNLLV